MAGCFARATALSIAALAAAAAASGPVQADEYFSGKTITVQVPAGSGGTYHVYCQIVQRHIGQHIPGDPVVVIQNQPGGGGAKSAAYMAHVAPKNGTYIAMIAPGAITVPLWREVKFDATKFNWLGSIAARSNAIWFWHTTGIRTLDDLKTQEATIATTGFSSGGSVWPRMVNKFLGTKMKMIYGYKGGGALNLAVERGEAQGRWNYRSGFTGVQPTWLPEKKIVPVIAMGPRDPKMKDIPHFRDLLEDGSVEQKAYDVMAMNFEVGQAFYAPPGVPKEVMDILNAAFARMIADPKTKQDIIERRIEYSPRSAAEVNRLIENGFEAATPEVVALIREVYTKNEK